MWPQSGARVPRLGAILVGAVLAITGCSRDFLNGPLQGHRSNAELLPVPANAQPADPDEPYIVLSFSGGGVRATGFSYAVPWTSSPVCLTARAERSLTWRASFPPRPAAASPPLGSASKAGLKDLRDNFIARNNMWAMESQIFNPVTPLGDLLAPAIPVWMYYGTASTKHFSTTPRSRTCTAAAVRRSCC